MTAATTNTDQTELVTRLRVMHAEREHLMRLVREIDFETELARQMTRPTPPPEPR